jgi:RNA polymerase sigma-70 factor (sigma-E family)
VIAASTTAELLLAVPTLTVAPGRRERAVRGPGERETQAESISGDDPSAWDADTAVSKLYSTHWNHLVRLAALLTRDSSVAEEIVQDAFIRFHGRWERLADPGAASAYLRASVINGARSALRHRSVEERHRQPAPPDPAGPEELAVRADADARVLTALHTLSRRQREVLVLRYYGDLSELEIAQTLGLSRGAVKSHAHRGLASLKAALVIAGEVQL